MFKAGQEIVAVRNHPDGVFRKGSIFMVREIARPKCGCMSFIVDIGFKSSGGNLLCAMCNRSFKNHTSIWWFANYHFVPIDSLEALQILDNEEEAEFIEKNSKPDNDCALLSDICLK